MKAITLQQLWATLIAIGAKQFETRSWQTTYRGPIAIHAAKVVNIAACQNKTIRETLATFGYRIDELPTGAVLAIAKLQDCLQSTDVNAMGYDLNDRSVITSPESEFGDFSVGRFAWKLTDVKRLDVPIPMKGQQRLWNIPAPIHM